MAIDIRGIPTDTALRRRVTERLTAELAKLAVQPVNAQVIFADENGPKGGRAMRCAVTIRVPRRAAIHVEHLADTSRSAFDHTLAALERELERHRERYRESKRYPKKYYAAQRLLAPEVEPPAAPGGAEATAPRPRRRARRPPA
jgi:ribosome-associated translation inhibitor RaiA